MRRAALPHLVPFLLILSWSHGAPRADIIHLKNGGQIVADSWEDRGDVLIVVQGGGRITVPRADVLRVEATPPAKPAQAPAPQAGPAVPPVARVPFRRERSRSFR